VHPGQPNAAAHVHQIPTERRTYLPILVLAMITSDWSGPSVIVEVTKNLLVVRSN
jgi:hypothetical protein